MVLSNPAFCKIWLKQYVLVLLSWCYAVENTILLMLALLFTSIERCGRELVEVYFYDPSVSSWHVWDNSTLSSISIGDI
jgi:hypothetical protein